MFLQFSTRLRHSGFKYATYSGTTWGIDDVTIPEGKKAVVASAKEKAESISEQFNMGSL